MFQESGEGGQEVVVCGIHRRHGRGGKGRLLLALCCTRDKSDGLDLVEDQREQIRSDGSLLGLLEGMACHSSP